MSRQNSWISRILPPDNMVTREIEMVRDQVDNKWMWYEFCKVYKPVSVDELVELTGLEKTSFMFDGFGEWEERLLHN